MAGPELLFAPLGGIGEIGMNLSIYGVGDRRRRSWLIVDCGVSFAAEEHLPGVDLILPDIRFLVEERRNIVGLVLTHAHEDHMGALIDLWPLLNVPLYATPFAAALFEARRLSEPGAPRIPVNVVRLGGRLSLGPFTIDFINVAHSIPESNALAIRTPLGIVVHTGDWKIDATPLLGAPTDQAKLTALGDEGVLALVGDSTNAVRDGRSPSEAEVAKTLAELIRTAPARVAVTTFASHVGRIRAVADAARAAEREVVLVGRAMERVVQVARETGYLDGVQDFRQAESYGYLPPDKVLALCTGSQGEPRAALARIAQDEHPEVTLTRGDRVIFSARTIPGNEIAVSRVINGLVTQGVEVITDRDHLVHVSGHPRRAELLDMIGWVRPRILVPAHGEALHLGRTRQARPRRRRAAGAGLPQRRPGSTRARAGGDHRRGAFRASLQGRLAPDRRRVTDRRGAPAVELCRHRLGGAGGQRDGSADGRSGDRADRRSGDRRRWTADGRNNPRCGRGGVGDAAEAAAARSRRGRRGDPPRRPLRHCRALEQEADLPRPCAERLTCGAPSVLSV